MIVFVGSAQKMAGIPGIQVTVRQAQVELRLDQDIRGYKLCSALFPAFNSYFAFEIKQVLLMGMGQADMEVWGQDQGSRWGGWSRGGSRRATALHSTGLYRAASSTRLRGGK